MVDPKMRERVGFLVGRCSASNSAMVSWLYVDEFVIAINHAIDSGAVIDDKLVLDLMEQIMPRIEAVRINRPNFNIRTAKRGMQELRRAVEEQSKQPV